MRQMQVHRIKIRVASDATDTDFVIRLYIVGRPTFIKYQTWRHLYISNTAARMYVKMLLKQSCDDLFLKEQ